MEKEERKKVIKEIGDLIELHCRGCPNNTKNPVVYCENCQVYAQLRALGSRMLDEPFKPTRRVKMDPAEFVQYKRDGLTLAEITKRVGCSRSALYDWRKKHAREIKRLEAGEEIGK
ncbi:MAG: zinc-finger domain-containing protein [Weizmannia coagulans]|jgi:hypothetical protein|nr:zinc-finger domain-containing protein [Heyndrickxia coagulans]